MQKRKMPETQTAVKFSTTSGVFVPSVLAILGAVMYLIAPKVLGGVGLIKMFAILVIAHAITIATAYSISAIATNIKVKGGGLYYLISRSLGREFGGSMGIQLYLAQTIGAAFYTIAFTEAFHVLLGSFGVIVAKKYLAMFCLLVFSLAAFRGARFVIKLQYFILLTILLSIGAVFLAPNNADNAAHMMGDAGEQIAFWVAFALFFPAVTGIDAGVGMSGELKNPRQSLVRGTFAAIIFTFVIYSLLMLKLSYAATPLELSQNLIVVKIANYSGLGYLVYAGILVATISSALSYLMTGPRTLRAMVDDKIFPQDMSFMGKGLGESKEPHVALLVSFIIGEMVIFFGGLEIVSAIVAMFFLNVYGWINGAAFLEKLSNNPSYRPTFNSPLGVSFFGMIACYFVMYLFNPYVMIIGILFQMTVFLILTKNRPSVRYESVWEGVLFQLFRGILNRIEESHRSKKNWRPTVISFSINERNHTQMFSMLDWISSNRSIMKMYAVIKGNIKDKATERAELEAKIKDYVKEYDLELFPRVIVTPNFEVTFETVVQSETVGNLPLNTILMDFDERIKLELVANISLDQKKNFIIMRNQTGVSDYRKIDVWWKNPHNGNFALLLAYLITESRKWRAKDSVIRVYNLVPKKEDISAARDKVNRMIAQSRIDNVEVNIIQESEKHLADTIHKTSAYSDLVIIGLPRNSDGRIDKRCINKVKTYTKLLGASLIVSANDEIDFKVN